MSAAAVDAGTEPEASPTPPEARAVHGRPFTSESAKEARRLRGTRSQPTHSDEDIERGLRARASTDPRAAEILLRWMARPRDTVDGDELGALSTEALEGLHAVAMRLSSMDPTAQQAFIEHVLSHRK